MNKLIYKLFIGVILVSGVFQSCFNDLDSEPIDPDITTAEVVYDDPSNYIKVLAKLYAGLAVTGQQGPAGQGDISSIDEGFGQYLRMLWYHQELSTDEALIAWNDQTIKDFHEQDWDANDGFINAMYKRIYYQIPLANEFLRETTDEKLSSRGVDGALRDEIQVYRAEARFLRALSYWHALDLYRNVPFVTESDPVGAFFPDQVDAATLFDFIETELKEIETQLIGARQNEYARADQGAAWMLLAKLYLNAEVYIGERKYDECVEYCQKLINAGYTLESDYKKLFMADNGGNNEFIFPIAYDGIATQTYGGTTFIVHAQIGGPMVASEYGADGGWQGTKTTSAIVNKFPSIGGGEPIVTPVFTDDNYPILNVPGDYQGWDPGNNDNVIKSRNSDGIYEAFLYFPDDNNGFKIAEGSWDVNYGDNGADGTLDSGGDNIFSGAAGVYYFSVDYNNLTYTLTPVSFGIIGDATPGGWDSDTDMLYDSEEGAFIISLDLTAGEVKFRANDDWAINYGDNGSDAILDSGGDNIAIPSAGFYEIKLYVGAGDYTYSIEQPEFDFRSQFYSQEQVADITNITTMFNDNEGFMVTKFTNIRSDGSPGSNLEFMDTDFPVFRLADVYLMYAEAVLRGGSGDRGTALDLVNQVRSRGYGGVGGTITQDELTLPFILDERARELLWECHRRTDLVRFEQFSDGSYVWPWKGGVPEGKSVPSMFDIYPIPNSDITANPNLQQNQGY